MKRHSILPKAPGLEPHHQIIYCHINDTLGSGVGVFAFSKDAVSIFYSPGDCFLIYLRLRCTGNTDGLQ